MLIDQEKLIELLVETSGLDQKKVEKHIKELVKDIKQAVEEGDAYEIPGFGMFTGFGNMLSFIPSKELETEINYKYVGMEPIELDEGQVATEEETVAEEGAELDSQDNPFAGLIDDEDIIEADKIVAGEEITSETEEEAVPGTDKWGIDTYKDDSAESVFGTMLGDDVFEEPEQEESASVEEEEVIEDPFEEIAEEEAKALEPEVEPEQETEEPAEQEEEASLEDDLAKALEGDDDDPFAELVEEEQEAAAEEPEPEPEPEKKEKKKSKRKDVVPVIRDVSSGKGKKAKKEEEKVQEEKKEEPVKSKKPKPKKNKKEKEQASPLLLMITLLVVASGAVVVLAMLDIIYIPGLSNETPQTVVTNSTPVTPAPTTPAPQAEPQSTQPNDTQQNNTVENEDATPVGNEQVTSESTQNVPQEQPQADEGTTVESVGDEDMGLFGKAEHEMTDVYTLVLYSLSNEQNARAKVTELEAEGLKARITPYDSERFGRLWRVSIGHFATQRDAIRALDDVDEKYLDNFFITKL